MLIANCDRRVSRAEYTHIYIFCPKFITVKPINPRGTIHSVFRLLMAPNFIFFRYTRALLRRWPDSDALVHTRHYLSCVTNDAQLFIAQLREPKPKPDLAVRATGAVECVGARTVYAGNSIAFYGFLFAFTARPRRISYLTLRRFHYRAIYRAA